MLAPFRVAISGGYQLDLIRDPQTETERVRTLGRSATQIQLGLGSDSPALVSAALGMLLVHALGQNGGLLLHGAFMLRDDRAFLFLGRSGAGKSTAARNARSLICLHDDKVAVRYVRGCWRAFGVPMLDNRGRPGKPGSAPIDGLYFVRKSDTLDLVELRGAEAVAELAENVILPAEYRHRRVFETVMALAGEVRSSLLRFTRDSRIDSLL
ncbi:MAG: hypothetical protein JXR96_14670 [Deltaproteobacteria bacterium]|nr:hypothetical protein [Deltaproteobacteria bacterium]